MIIGTPVGHYAVHGLLNVHSEIMRLQERSKDLLLSMGNLRATSRMLSLDDAVDLA